MSIQKVISIDNIKISNNLPFVFIAGPCQIESLEHSLKICDFLMNLCFKLNIPFIFKSSFDKANRTSEKGKRGIGVDESIKVFEVLKKEFNCKILTDIHNEKQCEIFGNIVDVLQIPAFLCRQTDLIKAAFEFGKVVNIKKGQFLAPWDMTGVISKVQSFNLHNNLLLTERGNSFGYNNLVVDMKSLDIMSKMNYPVIIDATHAVQQPGGMGSKSGGNREFAPNIAKASIASCKIAGVFCEVHEDPDNAPSDGPNMLNFQMTEGLLSVLKKLDQITKDN